MVFTTCFVGTSDWVKRSEWLNELEATRARYPRFNVSFFAELIVTAEMATFTHNAIVITLGQVRC